jgi:hypothetical protein
MVLPWPGSTACNAPNPNAASSASRITSSVMLSVLISETNAVPERSGAFAATGMPERTGAAIALASLKVKATLVLSNGLATLSPGYDVSAWLTSCVGKSPVSSAPVPGRTTISRQPRRSAKLPSTYASATWPEGAGAS